MAIRSERAPRRLKVLGAPHARVGLERDPAQEAQDAAASKAADAVPDDVAHERGDPSQDEDENEAQAAGPGHGAGREQHRHRGDWQPDLLREHPAEDDYVAVADENVDEVVHGRQVQTAAIMLAGS